MPVFKQLFASPDEDMRASAVNGVARVHTPEAVALLERDPPTCCLVGNESGAFRRLSSPFQTQRGTYNSARFAVKREAYKA